VLNQPTNQLDQPGLRSHEHDETHWQGSILFNADNQRIVTHSTLADLDEFIEVDLNSDKVRGDPDFVLLATTQEAVYQYQWRAILG